MDFRKYKYLFFAFFICVHIAGAQTTPIGYWSSLLPYNTCVGVATDGTNIYAVANQAFFTYDPQKDEFEAYSKVNGMSDIGMQCVAYDAATSTTILAYSNGNIDLFKDHAFYNIPDLKLKTVAGEKKVYSIYVEAGKTYLSTSLGIVVIDLESKNIEETYQFVVNSQLIPITGLRAANHYFYATTPVGLYKAPQNSPQLQNFNVWQKIDSVHNFTKITSVNNRLFLSTTAAVYELQSDTVKVVFSSPTGISNIDSGINKLFIGRSHDLRVMDMSYHIIDSVVTPDSIAQAIQLLDSSIWIANLYGGLSKRFKENTLYFIYPTGPANASNFDIYAKNNDVWIAHGGYDNRYVRSSNASGFSNYNSGRWKLYSDRNYDPVSYKIFDFVAITKNELDGTVYAGSFDDGLFELKSDGSYAHYRDGSFLDHSVPNGNEYQVVGTAVDNNNNVWVTMYGSEHELYVKENGTSSWYKYALNYPRGYPYNAGPMVFDDANHVWYVCRNGGGIIGYDTKNTLSNLNDDASYLLSLGKGSGNLPSGNALCIAKDKNDNLWIGTDNGIGIVYNASGCISQHCDAEIPIVQYDNYAGYLFANENVRTIAVDGGNRKWIGTNNGVWLLSPDAGNSSIIQRFTVDNSPLPSNKIQKIAVDGVTGDVYIGTEEGLMCYRGTAVDGGETNSNVMSFPNPVPSGYKGTIAIKGFSSNADVRITDINGQLIYRTTALGGQAVWNGLDYKGRRPQSGVYLIFSSNADGTQTYAGKMVFLN